MSYKKLVAGIATAAVASAMVVPAAFAISSSDYKDLKDETRYVQSDEFKKVVALEGKMDAAEKALNKAKEGLADVKKDIEKYKNDNGGVVSEDLQKKLTEAQNKVAEKQDAYDAAKKVFESSRDDLKDTDAKARVSSAYKDADKDSKKYTEDKIEEGRNLLVDVRTTDLTSLDKTYRQQVRTIETKAVILKDLIDDIDANYENWEPAKRQAKAEELAQLISVVKGALNEIPDSVLAKAKKADVKKEVKVVKKGSALPKTSDVAPVAPIAAVAGSAALIAAGLVASRKVNA